MNSSNESLAFERLLDAADAGLRASREVAEYRNSRKLPWPSDLMGSPDQPDFLAEYTLWEMQQATAFLVRLGMLPPRV